MKKGSKGTSEKGFSRSKENQVDKMSGEHWEHKSKFFN